MIQESPESAKRVAQVPPLTAGLSVRAVHCTGAETVGRTRRGGNSVGQAAGGWSAASTQLPRESRTSSPAPRLGSPGCEPPTNGDDLQSERDALAAQIHAVKTGLSRADRQADLQNAFADGDDVQILELISRMAKGAELLIQLTRQSEMSDDEFALRGAPGEGWFAPY